MAIIHKLVRTCETCNECKVNEQFYRDRRGALTYECKSCHTERMRPEYARQAIERREKRLKKLGLPSTASAEEESAAERAAFSQAWKAAGPFERSISEDLKSYPRRTEVDEARYHSARRRKHAEECWNSELAAAYKMTDEDIEALPASERDYQRRLRADARELAAGWGARAPPTGPQTDLSRLVESIENPPPARAKAREQLRARNARRDPAKARLSAVKNNLRRLIKTAEAQAAKRAGLTPHAARGDVGAQNTLATMERDEWLNQQAQAKCRAEIEALETTIEGNQAP